MGVRARSAQTNAARVAASSVILAAAAVVYAACGLSVSATGGPPVDALGAPDSGEAGTDEGDAGQGGCTPERAVCGDVCTDLSADPLNCGQCGKACGDGQTCTDSKCTVLCGADTQKCDESCVDTTSDELHCGSCPTACASALVCAAGQCTVNCGALSTCPKPDAGADAGPAAVYCANKTNDRNNCGACGTVCKPNETCSGSACKALCAGTSRIGEVFAGNMVGCVAKVAFASRASVCPGGSTVCTGAQWIARRGAKTPTYNYWTNDNLRWSGVDGKCAASATVGVLCGTTKAPTPMRVCGKKTDPVGNACNWTDCGFGTTTPNQYFGGCVGNTTAGTLCCTP